MKHFKQTLCALLSLLMILSMSIAGVSAETSTPDTNQITPGTVLYAEDFEHYWSPTASGEYPSANNFNIYGVDTSEGNNRFKFKVNTSNGSQFEILSPEAMEGVKNYSLSYTMYLEGNVNSSWWFNFIGVRLGANPLSLNGDWVGIGTDGGGDYFRIAQSYNSNMQTKKLDRLSSFNRDIDIRIDVNTENQTVKLYIDGVYATESTTAGSVVNGIYFTTYTGTTNYVPTVYLDDVIVLNTDTNETVYAEDFEDYNETASNKSAVTYNYTSAATIFAIKENVYGIDGNSGLYVYNSSYGLHNLVPEQATSGVNQYTLSFKLKFDTSKVNWPTLFGVRLGEFNSANTNGTFIHANYPGDGYLFKWKTFVNQGNTAIGSAVVGEHTANGLTSAKDRLNNVKITVNNETNTIVLYVDNVKILERTDCILGDAPIHLFIGNAAAWIDDVVVTAGIDKAPSITDSCQLSAVNDGKYSIRFNAGFNGKLANVNEVGYKVVATWNDGEAKSHTYTKTSSTVFTSILAENDGVVEEISAAELGGEYIFALAIDEVPATEGMPITFAFTSFVKTDSATIYGATKTVTVTYSGGELIPTIN